MVHPWEVCNCNHHQDMKKYYEMFIKQGKKLKKIRKN
jgi:hypothetical protein